MQTTQSNKDSIDLVDALVANWEDETVEFKEAGKDYSTDKIGKYVSALSNEANIAGLDSAWLIFGVRNKTREVVGSEYRVGGKHLSQIKRQVFDGTIPNLALRSVREVDHPKGRVVVFEIPQRPKVCPYPGRAFLRPGRRKPRAAFHRKA